MSPMALMREPWLTSCTHKASSSISEAKYTSTFKLSCLSTCNPGEKEMGLKRNRHIKKLKVTGGHTGAHGEVKEGHLEWS